VSYDSTNKNCKAGEIEKAEYGHAKEDCGAPIFNYAVAYDVENQVPLIYECYPGSIVDVSQLQYAIEKLQGYGYRDIAMILDRGYFSKDNIRFMESCGFAFVIMVRGKASFVNELILEKRGLFETKRACVITAYDTYGMTIREKLYADDEKERYFHLYYSMSRQCAERVQLENTLRQMEDLMDRARGSSLELAKPYEHYFNLVYHEAEGVKKFYGYSEREDVIEEELKTCGYFALVTSEKMTATEALPLYKSRDASEKLFCSDKSFLGNRTARAMSDDVLEGKIFVEFVALIIRSRIYTLLRKRVAEMPRKPNFMTVPAALRELEKIELIRQPNGAYKLDHAITATQKTILGAFGLDESAVRIAAAEIGTELQDAKEAGKETDDAPY
jgi:transposase